MGKTNRGEKGAGFDYWGKRPLSGNCGYGKRVKTVSKKIERARAKQALKSPKAEDLPNKEAF